VAGLDSGHLEASVAVLWTVEGESRGVRAAMYRCDEIARGPYRVPRCEYQSHGGGPADRGRGSAALLYYGPANAVL
jgi:hypothetical protein